MGEYIYNAFSELSISKFFSLIFVIRETCVGSCPTGMYGNNGLCYLFKTDNNGLSWMDASSYCKNNGGNLLSIVDYTESRLLAQYLSNFPGKMFYIGLNDIQSEGNFVWSDNQIASSFFWEDGEPGGGTGENCVIIYARHLGDLFFGDVDCNRLFYFVCKFKDYCYNIQCSANAECINLINGYTCRCLSGFKTSSGFIGQLGDQCQDINECALSEANICSNKTVCNNFAGGYSCTCKCGFKNNNSGVELLLDTCQVENCSLLAKLSVNYLNGEVLVYISMSTDCLCDINNVSVYLEPEPLLVFKGFVWDISNVNNSNVESIGKFLVIHVDTLSKTQYASFSSVFVFGEKIPPGKTNMTVTIHHSWVYFSQGLKTARKIISVSIKGSASPVNKMTPTCSSTQPNGTLLYTGTHQFVCTTMQKWQPSPCYQREVSTGRITFLPVQVLEVIGYNSSTAFIYGLTTRKNFIEVNLNDMKPYVITKEKCSKIKECNFGVN